MVILQVSTLTVVRTTAKLPVIRSAHNQQKHLAKRPSSRLPPSLYICNSQQPQYPSALSPPVDQSVAAIIFGDGSESRLYPLTKRRSEGAIPLAAKYRLVDAVVSNCINSNINKIYALTQFNSTSLNLHLSRAYSGLFRGRDGFVEVIAAYQSPEDEGWFKGNADAIRRCLWVLGEYPVTEFLVLPGHHLYKMDYQKLIHAHRNSKADITIVALNAVRHQDPGFGLLKVNTEKQVTNFITKSEMETGGSISEKSSNVAHGNFPSMGVYLFNRDAMSRIVTEYLPRTTDLGSEVLPAAISIGMKVEAYLFDGYWEDMRSIEAFYYAHMECIKRTNMKYNFYDRDCPVYTLPRCLPPTLIREAIICDSIIGDGCIIDRCKIKGTIVGMRTRIGDGATIEDSVIMGADVYQVSHAYTFQEEDVQSTGKTIPLGIGADTQIKKAIIDKNARIGRNVMIINKDGVQEGDREGNGYCISGGIVVILHGAEISDGSII